MTTPVPPRSQSPLMQLKTSPRTCVEMITTASFHPQRRCRNHPIPAVARAAASKRKKVPTALPRGELPIRHRIESEHDLEPCLAKAK